MVETRKNLVLTKEETEAAIEAAKATPHDVLAVLFVVLREAFIIYDPVGYSMATERIKEFVGGTDATA